MIRSGFELYLGDLDILGGVRGVKGDNSQCHSLVAATDLSSRRRVSQGLKDRQGAGADGAGRGLDSNVCRADRDCIPSRILHYQHCISSNHTGSDHLSYLEVFGFWCSPADDDIVASRELNGVLIEWQVAAWPDIC